MKKTLFTFSLTFLAAVSMAQETLSLGRCLQMGIERNLDLKTYEGNVLKGKHDISENRARLLPQINIGAGLNDNFTPPVSVTDGSAYGKPYNVTKTLQYNSSASIQLQMPLYSQTALTALSISKTLDHLNTLSYAKAKEDLIVQISKMYYLAQNTEEQIGIIKDNIKRLEELRDITQAFHDNDMALSVDVKRVSVNLENLSVQYDNAKAMLTQQYNMLKYIIDYPADKDIAVEKADIERTDLAALTGLNENLYELQLLRTQQNLAEQKKKLAKDGYLPTLALTGNWTYTAFTDRFKNWFQSGESSHWFDGFEKRSKIRKAQVDIDNARLSYENALKGMQTQYANAVNDLANNQRNFSKQRDNYLLAEDVYKVTSDRYREGIASMTEVLQDEMSMSDAQNNYLTAHFNYQVSNLTLLKLTGQLEKLMK